MSALKKITALLICMVVLCSILASCQPGADGGANGGAPLQSDKYVATITVKYTALDSKLKDAVEAIGSPEITVSADGDNLKVESFVATKNISTESQYVLVDGTLYHFNRISVDDLAVTTREKSGADESSRKAIIESVGPSASIGVEDFAQSGKTESNGSVTYVCNNINDESANSLCDVFAAQLSAIGATVRLESASYQVTLTGEREDKSTLTCNFIVTLDGADYSVLMRINSEYDYDASVSISAPGDADKYTEVSSEEIIG